MPAVSINPPYYLRLLQKREAGPHLVKIDIDTWRFWGRLWNEWVRIAFEACCQSLGTSHGNSSCHRSIILQVTISTRLLAPHRCPHWMHIQGVAQMRRRFLTWEWQGNTFPYGCHEMRVEWPGLSIPHIKDGLQKKCLFNWKKQVAHFFVESDCPRTQENEQ